MSVFKTGFLLFALLLAGVGGYFEYIRERYVVEYNNLEFSSVSGIFYSCSNANLLSESLFGEIVKTPSTQSTGFRGEEIETSEFRLYIDLVNGDEFIVEFETRPSLKSNYYAIVSINDQSFKTIEGTKLERKVRRYCKYGA